MVGWEICNLCMIVNVCEVFCEWLGVCVLLIVGVLYKLWFDDGFGCM